MIAQQDWQKAVREAQRLSPPEPVVFVPPCPTWQPFQQPEGTPPPRVQWQPSRRPEYGWRGSEQE